LWSASLGRRPEISLASLGQILEPPPGQYWLVDFSGALAAIPDFVKLVRTTPPARALLEELLPTGRRFGDGWHHYGAKVLAWSILEAATPGRAPSLAEPPPRAPTLEGALALFTTPAPWDDVQPSLARFHTDHAAELAVIALRRDEAIPRLLAAKTPYAAQALAFLRAPEAEAWFRALLADRRSQDWDTGSSFPRAALGAAALEHLHRKPLAEIAPPSARELRELRALARKRDNFGAPAYARWLLDALGKK
jgi:hypothetical protein